MKDDKIIALFFQRDEQAISEVQNTMAQAVMGSQNSFWIFLRTARNALSMQ